MLWEWDWRVGEVVCGDEVRKEEEGRQGEMRPVDRRGWVVLD